MRYVYTSILCIGYAKEEIMIWLEHIDSMGNCRYLPLPIFCGGIYRVGKYLAVLFSRKTGAMNVRPRIHWRSKHRKLGKRVKCFPPLIGRDDRLCICSKILYLKIFCYILKNNLLHLETVHYTPSKFSYYFFQVSIGIFN